MPYVTKYKFHYTNELTEEILIEVQELDGEGDVQEYIPVRVSIRQDGEEGKSACIYGLSLDIEFNIRPDDTDYWEDIKNATQNSHKVIAYNDGQVIFIGFILPDEGVVPLLDKPYNAKITAVDGIGLIREKALTWPDGTNFNSHHALITYIGAALQQTGLTLSVRVYDNVYHASHLNRDDGEQYDMLGQTFLEYRSFLKNATEFVDCYTALEIILKGHYRLFQCNGEWRIIRLSLLQYWPFGRYATVYDYNGANPIGIEILEDYGTIGKAELIRPIKADQLKYTKKAVKSVTGIFNYAVWPEIPRNNKFSRGNPLLLLSGPESDTSDIDGDGNTTEIIGTRYCYTVDDWVYGTPASTGNFENLLQTTNRAYIKTVTDDFGVEKSREVVLENFTGGGGDYYLRSEIFSVNKGDKIKVSVDHRLNYNSIGTYFGFAVGIRNPVNGNLYMLTNAGTWTLGISSVSYTVLSGERSTDFHTASKESTPIPFDGSMFILLKAPQPNFSISFYQNFNFEYLPFVAGGYQQVKGEKWTRAQDTNYADILETEFHVSDADHAIFKGCLLDSTGRPLPRNWYRQGIVESRHYNELAVLSLFNQERRRMQFIEGSFRGLRYAPSNDQENYQPLSFHKQYRWVDMAGEDRRFCYSAPLEMDLIKGWTTSRFHEVYKDGEDDGQQQGTNASFNYIF